MCFGTEHLYQRHDEKWLKNCRVRHYLLPVHLSEAFLFTPTLGSACYLLLLRWISRQFGDVFRLSDSCVSDTRLEPGVCISCVYSAGGGCDGIGNMSYLGARATILLFETLRTEALNI